VALRGKIETEGQISGFHGGEYEDVSILGYIVS
jgi:hypothetical protein